MHEITEKIKALLDSLNSCLSTLKEHIGFLIANEEIGDHDGIPSRMQARITETIELLTDLKTKTTSPAESLETITTACIQLQRELETNKTSLLNNTIQEKALLDYDGIKNTLREINIFIKATLPGLENILNTINKTKNIPLSLLTENEFQSQLIAKKQEMTYDYLKAPEHHQSTALKHYAILRSSENFLIYTIKPALATQQDAIPDNQQYGFSATSSGSFSGELTASSTGDLRGFYTDSSDEFESEKQPAHTTTKIEGKIHIAISDNSFENLEKAFVAIKNFIDSYTEKTPHKIEQFKFVKPHALQKMYTDQPGKFCTIYITDLTPEETISLANAISSEIIKQGITPGNLATDTLNPMGRDDIYIGNTLATYAIDRPEDNKNQLSEPKTKKEAEIQHENYFKRQGETSLLEAMKKTFSLDDELTSIQTIIHAITTAENEVHSAHNQHAFMNQNVQHKKNKEQTSTKENIKKIFETCGININLLQGNILTEDEKFKYVLGNISRYCREHSEPGNMPEFKK